jgi:hypothetical protein
VSDSTASEPPRRAGDRRAQRERRRARARARRRGLARLGALLVAIAVVVVLVVSLGGSSTAPPAVPTRVVIHMRTASLGTLPAAVQDAAIAAPAGGPLLLLGGIRSSQASTASVLSIRGGSAKIAGTLPEAQHDAQAAALGRAVYVFGGGVTADYDHILAVNRSGSDARPIGRLPRGQSDVGVATIGGTAYIVGGYDGAEPLDTIVAWRPGGAAKVVARLPFGLRYAAVAAVDGKLVIAGGTLADGVSEAILTYDPAGDGSVTQTGVLPDPVTHASAAVLDGRVYVLGGRRTVAGKQTAAIVEIDPATMVATDVGALPAPLSDAAVAVSGGRIVVAGGESAAGAPVRTLLAVTPRLRNVPVHVLSAKLRARRAFSTLTALGFAGALRAHPSSIAPYEAAAQKPGLPGYLLVADRGNNRILVLNPQGQLVWSYPDAADLAAGRRLHFNDDTFVEPGGRSLIANEEDYGLVVSIGIYTHRLTVLFGKAGVLGGGPTELNYPDDAYELADNTFTVADAYNCRILFVRDHAIVRQYGTGTCAHNPPKTFDAVNGDTPTPDGGVLVSEIPGWVDAISASGKLEWSVRAPVSYPSDPQPLPDGHTLLADYARPGHVVVMDRSGRALWRYGPAAPGEAQLNHPSLALQLPNGNIAVNDDYRDRVVVIDPHTEKIVWQYGHTDVGGTAPGYLHIPDGMDFIPAGPKGQIDWAAVVHP